MKFAAAGSALVLLVSTPALPASKIGEKCSGTETTKVNSQSAKIVPYSLTFSADLTSGFYCYAACRSEQTFAISNAKSRPIKLADLHSPTQTRVITFDPRSASLSDYHVMNVLGQIETIVTATCQAATFHEPTPLPGNRSAKPGFVAGL